LQLPFDRKTRRGGGGKWARVKKRRKRKNRIAKKNKQT